MGMIGAKQMETPLSKVNVGMEKKCFFFYCNTNLKDLNCNVVKAYINDAIDILIYFLNQIL